ncbi:MAG: hypothetical protein H6627_14955 [Calditrichae bacterium]|nr:hypothetical protein [Calditrichia bacterium]
MIGCNLFTEKERDILTKAYSKKLNTVLLHMLEYNNEFEVCSFVQLCFESQISIIITTGRFADDLIIIDDADLLLEKENFNTQSNTRFKTINIKNTNQILEENLISIDCIEKPEEGYYWQLKFNFISKTLNVSALIDAVEASYDPIQ